MASSANVHIRSWILGNGFICVRTIFLWKQNNTRKNAMIHGATSNMQVLNTSENLEQFEDFSSQLLTLDPSTHSQRTHCSSQFFYPRCCLYQITEDFANYAYLLSLDWSTCFDTLSAHCSSQLMRDFGLPVGWSNVCEDVWANQQRWVCFQGCLHGTPLSAPSPMGPRPLPAVDHLRSQHCQSCGPL